MASRKTALITGASQGIGASLAKVFAGKGYDLILTARSRSGLEKTAQEIRSLSPSPSETLIHIFPADFSQKNAVETLVKSIKSNNLTLDVLVNNAGFGYVGEFKDENLTEALSMIDVNIRALTELTGCFLEDIRKQKGGVLNIASVAAFTPGPGCAVYSATKAFVLSFSEALYQELKSENVQVSTACPGANKTGFFKRAQVKNESLLPGFLTRSPDWTARILVKQFLKKKRVIIPGFIEQVSFFLTCLIPKNLKLFLIYAFTKNRKDLNG